MKRRAPLGFIFVTLLIHVIGLRIIIPVIPKLISGLTGDSISQASQDGGQLFLHMPLQSHPIDLLKLVQRRDVYIGLL